MSENRFDPRKFAAYKFKAVAVTQKGVLKADKSGKPQPALKNDSSVPAPAKEPEKPKIIELPKPAPQPKAIEQPKPEAQPLTIEKPKAPETPAKIPARRSIFMDLFITALIAFLIALMIRTFFIQIIYVPSSAMEPALKPGDRVIVNKLVYGYLGNKKPARGEIVVFELPKVNGYQIKRVVGLPGEKIKIKNGQVFINGRSIQEDYPIIKGKIDMEQTPIMRGSYYVLGDNRDRSLDSRTYGAVPLTRMIGPVFFRIWPLNKTGAITY